MDREQWKKWWVDGAPTYFTDKSWDFSQPKLIQSLEIQKHDCVLEIGFGYGRELASFCALSDHVYGLELSDWACENTLSELEAKGVNPLPKLKSYDGERLPFPERSFHVVYSCFVMQHLSREHVRELIRESLRVVKEGGYCLHEFFGDPKFYQGGEDVIIPDTSGGCMYNNAFLASELPEMVYRCGGEFLWMKTRQVQQSWGNYWVCFTRKAEGV